MIWEDYFFMFNKHPFLSSPGERGQCVLDTPPKILFCDLRLDPGESKTCMFTYVKNNLVPQVMKYTLAIKL